LAYSISLDLLHKESHLNVKKSTFYIADYLHLPGLNFFRDRGTCFVCRGLHGMTYATYIASLCRTKMQSVREAVRGKYTTIENGPFISSYKILENKLATFCTIAYLTYIVDYIYLNMLNINHNYLTLMPLKLIWFSDFGNNV
jgi:hypothetical protein